jgi:hypothetical protein
MRPKTPIARCAMRYWCREKICDSPVFERMLFAARDGVVTIISVADVTVLERVVFGAE